MKRKQHYTCNWFEERFNSITSSCCNGIK